MTPPHFFTTGPTRVLFSPFFSTKTSCKACSTNYYQVRSVVDPCKVNREKLSIFTFHHLAHLLYLSQDQEAQTSCKFSCAWAAKYCFPCTSCNAGGRSCQTGKHSLLSFHLNCTSTRLATYSHLLLFSPLLQIFSLLSISFLASAIYVVQVLPAIIV